MYILKLNDISFMVSHQTSNSLSPRNITPNLHFKMLLPIPFKIFLENSFNIWFNYSIPLLSYPQVTQIKHLLLKMPWIQKVVAPLNIFQQFFTNRLIYYNHIFHGLSIHELLITCVQISHSFNILLNLLNLISLVYLMVMTLLLLLLEMSNFMILSFFMLFFTCLHSSTIES